MSERPVDETQAPVGSSAGALDLVAKGVRDGAADARLAAVRTWEATSAVASQCVYTTCYTLAYGVVFPAMLAARAVPRNNEAVRGLIDGAQAAIHKVDQLRGSLDTAAPAVSPA